MGTLLLFLLAGGATGGALAYARSKQAASTAAPSSSSTPTTYLGPPPGSVQATPAMPSLFMGTPVPPGVTPPSPPSPPPQSREVLNDPIPVYPGKHYSAAIQVTGLLAKRASESSIRSQAEGKGFTGVQVFKTMPQGWPGQITSGWYVSATYAGQTPSSFPRTNGIFLLGSVNIVDVWES